MQYRTRYSILVSLLLSALALSPALALAQTVSADASVNASAGGSSVGAAVKANVDAKASAAITRGKTLADKEIDRRTTALTDLAARIQQMTRVSAEFKTGLASSVQTQLQALASLKASIDSDDSTTTLKTDVQSITKSYRIYALILPQIRIAAAADRAVGITDMMAALGSKLQTRVNAAASAGADVSSLSSVFSDFAAKISDANAQAKAAVATSSVLQPDNGDKAIAAANAAALKEARADLKTAQADIVAARKDIATITAALAKLPQPSATASSTTSASAGTQ